MSTCKFYKITREAMEFYLKGSLDEQRLTNIINKVRLEKEFKNEDIYQETLLIKYLFSAMKYYEIEEFCDKFIVFIFNMPCTSKKTQADINLMVNSLEELREKINFRIHSQVDIHIYTLLKLNYIESLNDKNISVIFDNSSYMDDAIGIDIAQSNTYEQYSFFDDLYDDTREVLSKHNEEIKSNIQSTINSLLSKYYDDATLKKFIDSFNKLLNNIDLKEKDKKVISYLFNLKMKYYFKKARKNWQNNKKKAKNALKTYSLPLNYK